MAAKKQSKSKRKRARKQKALAKVPNAIGVTTATGLAYATGGTLAAGNYVMVCPPLGASLHHHASLTREIEINQSCPLPGSA